MSAIFVRSIILNIIVYNKTKYFRCRTYQMSGSISQQNSSNNLINLPKISDPLSSGYAANAAVLRARLLAKQEILTNPDAIRVIGPMKRVKKKEVVNILCVLSVKLMNLMLGVHSLRRLSLKSPKIEKILMRNNLMNMNR